MKMKFRNIEVTDEINVKLIQKMGGDHMVVAAAKVSVCGEDAIKFADPDLEESNAGLINYLMKHRHSTPFESGGMTFFVHAPIFVFREWHRHRVMSYNETSGRYSQLKPIFWIPREDRTIVPSAKHTSARPDFVQGTPEQLEDVRLTLMESYVEAYKRYIYLLDKGYAKEVSRACLPVGIYSSCWVTCNPRALMGFLSLRTHDKDAKFVSYPQSEIEEAAKICEDVLAEGWPLTYKAFVDNGRFL